MSEAILEVVGLVKHFRTRGGTVHAVDGVDLQLRRGETVGLVGESGCGKSTLGRLILQLLVPDAGQVLLDKVAVSSGGLREFRRRVQIVFQDPFRSLNPKLTVGAAVAEPLLIHGLATRSTARGEAARLLEEVGLDGASVDRMPHQFSGGQRQRIGIARALALRPEVLVLDEPVSALDVSVQAQIIQLLQQLQSQRHLSYLFISHNLGVVRHVADRVAVMYLGKVVEVAPVAELYATPRHPYTRALLEAVPEPDPSQTTRVQLRGETPDPINLPSGCRFHPRCRLTREMATAPPATGESSVAMVRDETGQAVPQACRGTKPELREIAAGHCSACHFAEHLAPLTAAGVRDGVAAGSPSL